MVSPLGLIAAGIGANGSAMGYIAILILCTYVVIFCVALKSKLYYKGDDRVSTFVANTFVVAGAIGCIPIFIAVLLRIPFLGEGILWFGRFYFFRRGTLHYYFSSNMDRWTSIDCERHWICSLLEKLLKNNGGM